MPFTASRSAYHGILTGERMRVYRSIIVQLAVGSIGAALALGAMSCDRDQPAPVEPPSKQPAPSPATPTLPSAPKSPQAEPSSPPIPVPKPQTPPVPKPELPSVPRPQTPGT